MADFDEIEFEKQKELFRKKWWERFTLQHGNVQTAADALGRANQSISRWHARGAAFPNIYEAVVIARALGWSPAALRPRVIARASFERRSVKAEVPEGPVWAGRER